MQEGRKALIEQELQQIERKTSFCCNQCGNSLPENKISFLIGFDPKTGVASELCLECANKESIF